MSIDNFGLYSFAISSTSLIIIFITAVSTVLYPYLKRIEQERLPIYFNKINDLLMILVFCCIPMYFIVRQIVLSYMPEFKPVLEYLYLLFPLTIFQSKIQLLINTFYKTIRKEKELLTANVNAVVLFIIITGVAAFFIEISVMFVIYATLVTLAYRCYLSEIYLKKHLSIKEYQNIVVEIVMIFGFVLSVIFKQGEYSLYLYASLLMIYLFSKKETIKSLLYSLKARKILLGKS